MRGPQGSLHWPRPREWAPGAPRHTQRPTTPWQPAEPSEGSSRRAYSPRGLVSKGSGPGGQGRTAGRVTGGLRVGYQHPPKTTTYISLKLNKLANNPSSKVEILLLLMSLEEKGDSAVSDGSPHNRNGDR